MIDFDKITLGDLKKLKNLMSDCDSEKSEETINHGLRIVVLQRGWVYIGMLSQKGVNCFLENAYCIRRWGTTDGLGQLALNGKTEDTILDKAGLVEYHKLTEIFALVCDPSKWKHIYA